MEPRTFIRHHSRPIHHPFNPSNPTLIKTRENPSDILNDPRVHRLLEPIARIAPTRPLPRAPRMATRPLAKGIRLRKLGRHIGRPRQEDDLAVRRLRHRLHGLEVADLHRGRGAQDVGGLAHQLGGLDLGAGGDDFGLADTFGLGGHGERVLQLGAEDDVLDQHGFDLDAPA